MAQVAVGVAAVAFVVGVNVAGVVAVFMCCFACGVAAGVVVAFLQGLCLWLCCHVHITDLLA